MKQIQVTVPLDKAPGVYNFIVDSLGVDNLIQVTMERGLFLIFRVPDSMLAGLIEKLKKKRIGVDFGFIDIIDLNASLPRRESEPSERTIQRESTLAVEEIYENVQAQASLSFDFLAFVVLAAAMAGFGLVQNNITIIVASMLLSPLMGPMLGVALGMVIGDRDLYVKGTVNELIALAISFAVGAVLAVAMPLIQPDLLSTVESDLANNVVTEITRRGYPFSALDIGIALFSGAAVAVSVTRGDMSALVGVAISAALMPPAVNVGMMLTLGVVGASQAAFSVGVGSLALLVMNIVLIDVAAAGMFRIKKLTAIVGKSAEWRPVSDMKEAPSMYHTRPDDGGHQDAAAQVTTDVRDEESPSKEAPASVRPGPDSTGGPQGTGRKEDESADAGSES